MPGICTYKLLYVWLDLILEDGEPEKNFVGSTGSRIHFFRSSGLALLWLGRTYR